MMKAVSYTLDTENTFQNPLVDIEKERPILNVRDVLVKVQAISVNPVDTKVRKNINLSNPLRVLGWDAVGEIVEVGKSVSNFKIGDLVWYAGNLTRDGSNAEFQAVDERIISLKPKTISDGEAAALPLTAITAWEMLFDRLKIDQEQTGNILIIGGGVALVRLRFNYSRQKQN